MESKLSPGVKEKYLNFVELYCIGKPELLRLFLKNNL